VSSFDSRLPLRPRCRGAVLLVVLLLAACTSQPVQRPREGAPPILGGTPLRLENVVPPTLSAFNSVSQTATPPTTPGHVASPAVASSQAPASSPGLAPIISGLQPAPGASLPAGDIVISARVTGSTDLADVVAFVDGEAIDVGAIGPSVRVKTVSFVRALTGGTHEVRIQARDEKGQLGGYRWQFTIGTGRHPAVVPTSVRPVPPTSSVQPRAPAPAPTRRPTAVLPAPNASPTPQARR
jgi:hypothetical protein